MAKLTRSQLADHLIGNRGKDALQQVAAYLLSSGRTKEADLIVREVEEQLSNNGRIVARVASARKLDADQQREIIQMIKNTTGAESVEIINEVDPSHLGGVVVRTPKQEVDLSIRSRLNRLKRA